MPRSVIRAATATIVMFFLLPSPAEGQILGRLQRAVRDRASDMVEGAEGPASVKTTTLPITAERLEQFIAAMQPAMRYAGQAREAREARKAHEAADAVVTAHNGRVEACAARVMEAERPRLQRLAANPIANNDALQRLQGYDPALGPMTEAMFEAVERGDQARVRVLEDSITVIKFRAMATVIPALAACGVPKSRPAEPAFGAARAPEDLIVPPAGMTRTQFGRLRERVALYTLTNGKEGDFTPAERGVLNARAKELDAMASLFRDGVLEWSQWGVDSNLGRAWITGRAP